MIAWLTSNLATIVVGIVFFAIVGLVIWSMVRDKKSGKSSCGGNCGGCSGCGMSGSCHPKR